MPTPLSSILGGAASTAQRRETYVLTTSNAALPIPSWAQGGKGIVYVTGCGGGAGGAAATDAGGSSASAIKHPLIIPTGATTMGLTIGAGGAVGASGGDTEISIGGTNALRLGGGAVGINIASPALWNVAAAAWRTTVYNNTVFNASLIHAFSSWTLQRGVPNTEGSPAIGPFGAATSGQPGTGYGSGGGINAVGAPGFLLLEFVEGK